MILQNIVRKNSYYDSATLMLLTSKIGAGLGSTKDIAVMMATDMNKEIMAASGLLTEEGKTAGPNDLVFAIRAESEEKIQAIKEQIEEELNRKTQSAKTEESDVADTLEDALKEHPGINVAVVSLPGMYAAREVKKLLKSDVHVLLFSDNVSVAQEKELKEMAAERGLLMMGPDCGTAVIGGVGLGFANKLRPGRIGIVAASGTGLQEVMCQISNRGGGVSQALGTGGRDVKEEIGGLMLMEGLKLLAEDDGTDVIVIVSKPPAKSVVSKAAEYLKHCQKKVVACFIGNQLELEDAPWVEVETLEEAARTAVELSVTGDASKYVISEELLKQAEEQKKGLTSSQRYIRGLYCGGTLAYEAMLMIRKEYGFTASNIAMVPEEKIDGKQPSRKHTILDLGDDEFTVGKPHPMIEPALREERLLQEALDPETAVILADVEIGYGSHENPAQVLADEIVKAKEELAELGRQVVFVASICGSKEDFQDYEKQKQILIEQGILVADSNAKAVELAMKIVPKQEV